MSSVSGPAITAANVFRGSIRAVLKHPAGSTRTARKLPMTHRTLTAASVVLLLSGPFAGCQTNRPDKADLHQLQIAAQKGHPASQALLALMYHRGDGIQQNTPAALHWFHKAAEQGHRETQALLGSMYGLGDGVPQDHNRAAHWFRKAATQGDKESQFVLALMYSEGMGVSQDFIKAHFWAKRAAAQGHTDAAAFRDIYAKLLQMSPAQREQAIIAVGALRMARGIRNVVAGHRLIEALKKAQGQLATTVPPDLIEPTTRPWPKLPSAAPNVQQRPQLARGEARKTNLETQDFKQLRLAAQQGAAEAQNKLGVMYAKGEGISEDDREAVNWFRRAAAQGFAKAQYNLGVAYANGRGVPEDHREAVKWFRRGADQGYAHAQINLGAAYANGEGVPEDDREAVKWFRRAAAQGFAQAQYNLGVMYAEGDGAPEGVNWLRKAADQGYAQAQYNLGVIYAEGRGVPEDFQKAAAWYRKAAEQGHAEAQSELGSLYIMGQGVPSDFQKAAIWSRKAAEQGDRLGQARLGFLYAYGEYGMPQDIVQAHAWLTLAADGRYTAAEETRDKLAAKMTPDQLARAQTLAAEHARRIKANRKEAAP